MNHERVKLPIFLKEVDVLSRKLSHESMTGKNYWKNGIDRVFWYNLR